MTNSAFIYHALISHVFINRSRISNQLVTVLATALLLMACQPLVLPNDTEFASPDEVVAVATTYATPTPGPAPTATPSAAADSDTGLAASLTATGINLFKVSDLAGAEAHLIDAIAAAPDYLPAHLGLTNVYLSQPQYWQQALAAAETAAELGPDDPDVLANLSWAQQGAHLFYEAWDTALRAVELGPENAMAHAALADVLSSVYEQDESLNHATRAVELDEESAIAWATLGSIQFQLHDWSAAGASYERAVSLEPDFFAWYLIAARHDLNVFGDVAFANDLAQPAIDLQPNHAWILAYMADAAAELNEWDESVAACKRLLALHQPHTPYPDAYICLAAAFLQQERAAEAAFFQELAEEVAPANRRDISLLRMRLLNDEDACSSSRALAQEWLDERAYSVVAKRMIGVSYLCEAAYAQAAAYFAETLETLPNSVIDARLLAIAYARENKRSAAMRVLDKVKEFAPDDPLYYQALYEVNLILGDMSNALEAAQRWQVLRPDNSEANTSIALVELLDGNLEASLTAAQKALAAGEESSTLFAVFGEALNRVGETADGEEFLLKSLALNSEHFLTRNFLTGLYLSQGRCEEAQPHVTWLRDGAEDEATAARFTDMMDLCERRAAARPDFPEVENPLDDDEAIAEVAAILEESGVAPRMMRITETQGQLSLLVAYSTDLAGNSKSFLELERELILLLAELLPRMTSQPEALMLVSGSVDEIQAYTIVPTRTVIRWLADELTDTEFEETWLRQTPDE